MVIALVWLTNTISKSEGTIANLNNRCCNEIPKPTRNISFKKELSYKAARHSVETYSQPSAHQQA